MNRAAVALSSVARRGMLHNILHQQKHWRQGGQLVCAFCTSATKRQPEKDPLAGMENNPYLDKYKAKIQAKQQQSPQEFEERLSAIKAEKLRQFEEAKAQKEEQIRQLKEKASQLKDKKLENVMKMELIQDKSAEEIEEIWATYHKEKNCIYAVIPADEYKEIHNRSQEFTTFLYPIPRDTGYDFYLQQFSGHEIFFTPLIEFQSHQENAPTCLTITHYPELMEDKGIVLMVGEHDHNRLSIYDAQLLAMQVKMYYGLHSGLKFNLVRQMKLQPEQFKYMDLVKEFENYKKDVAQYKELKS